MLRLLIDHRADIGRIVERIADGQLRHGAFEHRDDAARDVFLDEQHARRRAALAGAVESGGEHIAHRLLGKAEESTIIAFMPPVSAMSGRMAPSRCGERAVDDALRSRSSR